VDSTGRHVVHRSDELEQLAESSSLVPQMPPVAVRTEQHENSDGQRAQSSVLAHVQPTVGVTSTGTALVGDADSIDYDFGHVVTIAPFSYSSRAQLSAPSAAPRGPCPPTGVLGPSEPYWGRRYR
jgi:hypothetical protein